MKGCYKLKFYHNIKIYVKVNIYFNSIGLGNNFKNFS